jgi:hypothetical protein
MEPRVSMSGYALFFVVAVLLFAAYVIPRPPGS